MYYHTLPLSSSGPFIRSCIKSQVSAFGYLIGMASPLNIHVTRNRKRSDFLPVLLTLEVSHFLSKLFSCWFNGFAQTLSLDLSKSNQSSRLWESMTLLSSSCMDHVHVCTRQHLQFSGTKWISQSRYLYR